mgnify:CR=1 FL=1
MNFPILSAIIFIPLVGALFIFTIIAYLILQGVDDTPRDWPPEMQVDYVLEPPRGAMGRSR